MKTLPHEANHTLVAYLDGTLEPGGAARVAAHLGSCLTCERKLNEFRLLQGAVKAPEPKAITPRLSLAIEEAVGERMNAGQARNERLPAKAPPYDRRMPITPGRNWVARGAASMTAAVLLGGLAGLWVTRGNPPSTATHGAPPVTNETTPKQQLYTTNDVLDPKSDRWVNLSEVPPGLPLEEAQLDVDISKVYLRVFLRVLFEKGERSRRIARKGKDWIAQTDAEMGFYLHPSIQRAYVPKLSLRKITLNDLLDQVARSSEQCLVERGGKLKFIPHPGIRVYRRNGIYHFVPSK